MVKCPYTRQNLKDDNMDGRLSSLRPTFVTKVKDMLDTVRWLIVKARFADLRFFTFKAQKISL